MTQVFVINDKGLRSVDPITLDENPNDGRKSERQEIKQISLEDEKQLYLKKANEREKVFMRILMNKSVYFSSVECTGHLFRVVVIGFLATTPISLIPAYDLILYPERWYEALFHGLIGSAAFYLYFCALSESVLNLSHMSNRRNMLMVVLMGMLLLTVIFLASFFIWTHLFQYHFPVPLLGKMTSSLLVLSFPIIIWLKFPQKWRKNSRFRKRMMFYSLLLMLGAGMDYVYTLTLEKIRNSEYQHFVALVLPLIREIYLWISSKVISNCYNGDERRAKIFLQYAISNRYIITLCFVVGSFATDTTSWFLMIVDFSINVLLCLWFVWTRNRNSQNMNKQVILLQDLVVCELVEFHAPLSFIFVIALAFYGPNGNIIGNVGNSYWAFNAIEDIHQTLYSMGLFFLVDFSSTLVSAAILWFTCRINSWKALNEMQKEFGKSFCLVQIYTLVVVSRFIKKRKINILLYIQSYSK